MDKATLIGVFLCFLSIVGGHIVEGGKMGQIVQGAAFMIVFAGTFGGCYIQFSGPIVKQAFKDVVLVFKFKNANLRQLIRQLVAMSSKARRAGVLAIEKELNTVDDPFMKNALMMVADGMKVSDIKPILELEIDCFEEHALQSAKFWEAAGGYAPTIGILGAVLGLIQVMQNISDPSKLGSGIAVAFVATIYGVGSANLFFMPFAGKLRERARSRAVEMELIIAGTCDISDGVSPIITERKLAIYAKHRQAGAEPGEAEEAAADAVADAA
jgi:chemotaxis protein MotA